MTGFVFNRTEQKYLLNQEQYQKVASYVKDRLCPDEYGKTTILSLYFDTDSFLLARRSVEKPIYKEKLRLRSYGRAQKDTDVYLEIKRKYKDDVYKRRVKIKEDALQIYYGANKPNGTQIEKEISYFFNFYSSLKPRVLVLYERDAYYDKKSSLRITFDTGIRYRCDNLNLHSDLDGKELLTPGTVLMETKAQGALPLEFTNIMSEAEIYKTSFSKYGTAYTDIKNNTENSLCLKQYSKATL